MKTSVIDRLDVLRGDRILVRKSQPAKKVGRIEIPESYRDKEDYSRRGWRATIVQTGTDVDIAELQRNGASVGSEVVLSPASKDCPKFWHNEDQYFIVREEDIEAVVEDDE